jgi:pyruvate dehydrogenase E1 component alpha subunit
MPRLQYLSILAEDGTMNAALEPELSTGHLLRMYRIMLLARRLGQRLRELRGKGAPGALERGLGREGAHVGAAAALAPTDWMVPVTGEVAAQLWRGAPLASLLAEEVGTGRAEGSASDVFAGTRVLHAAGLAYGFAQHGSGSVVATFLTEGTASRDEVLAAVRFAVQHRAPWALICFNTAGIVPAPRRGGAPSLLEIAAESGMSCLRADGNDVLAVHAASRCALERAGQEGMPTLVECLTYPASSHGTEGPGAMLSRGTLHDPLWRFQEHLCKKGLLTDEDVQSLERELSEQISAAIAEAGVTRDALARSVPVSGALPALRARRATIVPRAQAAHEK